MIPHTDLNIPGPPGSQGLRLEEPVGAGAFGVVFKARDQDTGTVYAVKFPRSFFFAGSAEMAAFMNEIMAAQKIQHPNVVQIVHVETSASGLPPYIVMEFLTEGTLQHQLNHFKHLGDQVPSSRVRLWTEDLVNGIAAINDKMLHRDLKPDNIFLDAGRLKIGDFGLAKIVDAATRTESFKGRQHMWYMAPEGWKLEANRIQIDMYAMGIVLYQMASLEYPYQPPQDPCDIDGLREMHFFQQPAPLHAKRPELPMGYCHVVSRLMEKRPLDRFADWHQVQLAVESAWNSHRTAEVAGPDSVGLLLAGAAKAHHLITRQRLEEEKRAQEKAHKQRIDRHQFDALREKISLAIKAFNERSSLGRITENRYTVDSAFQLPYGGTIHLKFFTVDPPLSLRRGQVRAAAILYNDRRIGLNYLLCRADDADLYGEWLVCRCKQSASFRPRWKGERGPRPSPFGFEKQEIREIEMADSAIHIYEVSYDEDVGRAFADVVRDAFEHATDGT